MRLLAFVDGIGVVEVPRPSLRVCPGLVGSRESLDIGPREVPFLLEVYSRFRVSSLIRSQKKEELAK